MQLSVEGIQLFLHTISNFLINSSSHVASPPTGGVNSVAIAVPIAVVLLVLTGVVVTILIACVVWRYIRSIKRLFPVSSLLVVTRIDNTVYPLLHAVY